MESTSQEIGPVPPQDGAFVEDKDESELKASIAKRGQNSYYYAHNYAGQNFNDANAKKLHVSFFGSAAKCLLQFGDICCLYGASSRTTCKHEVRNPDRAVELIRAKSFIALIGQPELGQSHQGTQFRGCFT